MQAADVVSSLIPTRATLEINGTTYTAGTVGPDSPQLLAPGQCLSVGIAWRLAFSPQTVLDDPNTQFPFQLAAQGLSIAGPGNCPSPLVAGAALKSDGGLALIAVGLRRDLPAADGGTTPALLSVSFVDGGQAYVFNFP